MGFDCERVAKDRDSVDLHIRARGKLDPASTRISPQLAVQLKAHVQDPLTEGTFDFRLKLKNYDDLRDVRPAIPKILVVFIMPKDPEKWVILSEDEMLLRRCAYWCSLLGLPESKNEKVQDIVLSRKNVFDGKALYNLMVKASREEDISHDV